MWDKIEEILVRNSVPQDEIEEIESLFYDMKWDAQEEGYNDCLEAEIIGG